ncbi:PP2C family protein-serine/threonine phosphatase [Actinokineospora iranica]|uniref:Serine/threonine protein phosphatase PrpC n=1 Tax=Actinokineospora iranica TaxID=1271860 RepID=A0A1G6YX66_9PSEU|nr:SpoIIE family protein phosphatase [Actinokineospora iranica]SDD94930.1 Serine/threonine protein phosphatase PrpC [Actinokineospora iranica]
MSTPSTPNNKIIAAAATRRGVRAHNMDAAAVFRAGTGVVGAALVDGIGNDEQGAATMGLLAETAARIATTKGTLAGLLAAAALIEDPGVEPYAPNGVIVVAAAEPGSPTALAWVGDSHAYGWNGHVLRRRTDPHTMGAYLRQNGDHEVLAGLHDNWVRLSLTVAAPTNVARADAPEDELVLLVSDGLDDLTTDELTALIREHEHDPQALAEAIVATARLDDNGYRDDATAIVLTSRATRENG